MRALDRKLFRDLVRMRGQAAAIALMVASGVALFVAAVTTYRSLRLSQEHYYADRRFADIWSGLARAPRALVRDIARLPGVAAVDDRVVVRALVDVPGLAEPATALLISAPPPGDRALDDVYVQRGRRAEASAIGGDGALEAMVSSAFADKNHLDPGDTVVTVVAGRRIALRIVGVALSPEYVMAVPPGGVTPDDRRFAVLWIARDPLAALVDMRDAFDDVAVRLAGGADPAAVIAGLDRLLAPYGGRGAYGRNSQMSHVQLEEHIAQLESLTLLVPTIFLLVAAFLVDVVLSRLIATQREQIGMLKAFGYRASQIAGHYLALALVMTSAGIAVGGPIGIGLGRRISQFYAGFFRFPALDFRVEPWVISVAALVAIAAAVGGALGALRSVIRLPPMVAMSSEVPVFRSSFLESSGLADHIGTALRMIVRNLARRPGRAALTTTGMALAVAVVVLGGSSADGIDRMIDVQFHASQREDLSVVLAHRHSLGPPRDLGALPGVIRAEPFRMVAARLVLPGGTQDVVIRGIASGAVLRRIVGNDHRESPPPPSGVILSAWLGRHYRLHRGDQVALEIREGRRRLVSASITGFVDDPLGTNAYMDLGALGRLIGEPGTYAGLDLQVDPARKAELYQLLKRAPEVIAVEIRTGTLANFKSMSDTTLDFIRRIVIVFSIIIAIGVVYNGARIALAERGRELATLRVLGFTRGEVSTILLGEIGLLAVPAIPIGLAIGYHLSGAVAAMMTTERMHMPQVVDLSTYGFAVAVFAVAAIGSALAVRHRLDRLDLIDVLKARE